MDFSGDFRLGEAVVRPQARTIEVDAEAHPIDHKALQVLICLVRRAGDVVPKPEIFAEVWARAFVTDDVLTAAISRLRRTLGDEARAPRYIETVPSVGYRLIAPLAPAEEEGERAVEVTAAWPSRRLWLAVAALMALLLLSAAYLLRSPDRDAVVARSLAVLPLEDLTGDPGQAHLAAGMTEALITGLARQDGLRVVSRASVQRFEVSRPPLDEIARELGVDLLVEGSVQRSADRLRISARLIDAQTDRHLWADSFDGAREDILDLQEQTVMGLIGGLGPDGRARPLQPTALPRSPVAYEAYLRALYLLGKPASPRGLTEAVRELERAIAEEDDAAVIHLALAEAFLAQAEGDLKPPKQAFAQLRLAAERGLELDPSSARARALLAMADTLHEWDFAAAARRFEEAIALDPEDILARDGYSRLLTVTGRFEEALDQQRILRELNPLIYHQPYLAYIYNMARQHDLALQELQRQIALEPRSPRLHAHLASTYRWLSRPAEAIGPLVRQLQLAGASPASVAGIRAAFDRGQVAEVGRFLEDHYAGLEQSGYRIAAISRAEASTLAGNLDAALRHIERAVEEREPRLLNLIHSPDYDVLRQDPGFQAVLRRING